MTKAPKTYDFTIARHHVAQRGLGWNEAHMQLAEPTLRQLGINNHQANHLVALHADLMLDTFTPAKYTWRQRIGIALFFLGLVRR